jgi:prevent-host-death family protein
MVITTYSSRDFNQDTSGAKRAAENGPVYITDRGRPAHVLLSIEEYRRLTARPVSLADALAGDGDFAFDPPRLGGPLAKPADLG